MKLILFFGLLSLAFAKKTFFGDEVLTLHPRNELQAETIRGLDFVDFWSPGYPNAVRPGQPADIRVPSDRLAAFKVWMRRNRINFDVKIRNLQQLMDAQLAGRAKGIFDGNDYNYDVYHTVEEIAQWVTDITNDYSIATKMSLGKSTENRDIPMIKISTNENNPAIFVDCGFHAREWISPAFCQCYVKKLLEGYGSDAEITSTLNSLTVYVVPNINVDGYAYTFSDDRMWRKTRSPTSNGKCFGVDPNRNCDAGFGGEGSSPLPCQDTYHGPFAESEPEVKALSDFIRANTGLIKAYITFHAYGQMILYPYSYTYDLAASTDTLDYYAVLAQAAVKQKYRTRYIYGPGATTIYPAAGGSDDFAYDAGVPLSYTVELRDKGVNGFILPPEQIAPVCEETFDLMTVMHNAALDMA